jgi:hypothetical protein
MPENSDVQKQLRGGLSTTDPDRLIKWFVSVVVVGVAINLLSGFVLAHKWAWIPPAVLAAALMVVVPRTGLLRRERQGATRWARGLAIFALAAYLAVALWGSVARWPILIMTLSVAFLWGAGVLLMWSTLKSRRPISVIALGTSLMLVGSTALLFSGAGILNGLTSLFSTAIMLLGVASELGGVAFLLNRLALGGVSLLIAGNALIMTGVWSFDNQTTSSAIAFLVSPALTYLLVGIALWLGGGAFLLNRPRLGWIAFLPVGIASLWVGLMFLFVRGFLAGVEIMLLGVAFLLLGIAFVTKESTLVKISFLALAVPTLLIGIQYVLRQKSMLFGLASLLFGVASLLGGIALIYRPKQLQRVLAWLSRRDDEANTAIGQDSN